MSSLEARFNDKSGILEADRQADSLSLAHAGVHNGQNAAHLAALNSDALSINKRDKDKGADDFIDIILTQQPYGELLAQTYQQLNNAENTVEQLIDRAEERFNHAQDALDDIESKAAQTADGTRVARSSDGHVYNIENGKRISDVDAATIIWSGEEPSYEAIEEKRELADTALEALEAARFKEARLGEIREELEDEPKRKRIGELQDEIEGITNDANNELSSLQNSSTPSTTIVIEPSETVSTTIPVI